MELNSDFVAVKTRRLILSDMHGTEFQSENKSIQHTDVAIHCGDLTEESKLNEFRASIRLLQAIDAPLKLVIAGNHDFTMDIPAFRKKVAEAQPPLDPDLVKKEYGDYGETRQILEDARAAGVIFLDEGSHRFILRNGALLTVYASPYTPSLADWGFQYPPAHGHDLGIMDCTDSKQRAGCSDLFGAVARARPRLHCFGHIHEGWGAKMVTWRGQLTETPSHFTDIDNERSTVIEKLSGLRPSKFDSAEIKMQKLEKLEHYQRKRCYTTSHCPETANPLEFGAQTLSISAAIEGTQDHPLQLPWLVELNLPKAT